MLNLSALERGMHPTGSPIVGSPVASPNPLGSVMPPPPGLLGFVEASPLVQTLVSRESTARTEKGKGVGKLSDITDSTNRAMEVDDLQHSVRKTITRSWSVVACGMKSPRLWPLVA